MSVRMTDKQQPTFDNQIRLESIARDIRTFELNNPSIKVEFLVKMRTQPSLNLKASVVRRWAVDNGFEINKTGRIPGDVIEAYLDPSNTTLDRP